MDQQFFHLCTSTHLSSSCVRPASQCTTGKGRCFLGVSANTWRMWPGCHCYSGVTGASSKSHGVAIPAWRKGAGGFPTCSEVIFLLYTLQMHGSELIAAAGMHCHCLFRNIVSQRTSNWKTPSVQKQERGCSARGEEVHLSFPPLNGVKLTSSAAPSCVCPFEERSPSHRRFLKDRDVILDSQGRLGMPGLSILRTPECFALYKGVVQVLASCPKFSKHLQVFSPLCSKCIFSLNKHICGPALDASIRRRAVSLHFQHKGRQPQQHPSRRVGCKSHLCFLSNLSNQKKKLHLKLVRPFRKTLRTPSRAFGDTEGRIAGWSSQALPLILSDSRGFGVTSHFFELFCWCWSCICLR